MSIPRIEEQPLYSPLVGYLKQIGIDAVATTRLSTREPDILFKIGVSLGNDQDFTGPLL